MNEESILIPSGHPETLTTTDGAIYLRKASMDDLEELVTLVGDNREYLSKHQPWAATFTRENASQALKQNLQATEDGTFLQYRTVRTEDGRMVGTTTLYDIDSINDTAKMGYWLAEDAQGNNFAKAAAERVLQYGFTELNLHKVELVISLGNTPSERLATKLGAILTNATVPRGDNGVEVEHRVWAIYKDGAE